MHQPRGRVETKVAMGASGRPAHTTSAKKQKEIIRPEEASSLSSGRKPLHMRGGNEVNTVPPREEEKNETLGEGEK